MTLPWDNTEFDQPLTDTAYRATTSAAAGHYDFLTTILHEMGHLAGIIQGNPAYDRRVKLINGTPTFIGDTFTLTLKVKGAR
jgi:hypothetical protein